MPPTCSELEGCQSIAISAMVKSRSLDSSERLSSVKPTFRRCSIFSHRKKMSQRGSLRRTENPSPNFRRIGQNGCFPKRKMPIRHSIGQRRAGDNKNIPSIGLTNSCDFVMAIRLFVLYYIWLHSDQPFDNFKSNLPASMSKEPIILF